MRESARLLRQPLRRRILDLIQLKPGIKITRICEEAEAGWGTVNHHLHLLHKAGLVTSAKPGRDRLLFPADFPEEALKIAEVLCQGRAEEIARAIERAPGASQKDLCDEFGTSRKIMGRYLAMLSEAGLIRAQREAPFQRYYPEPELAGRLGGLAASEAAAPARPVPPR